MNNSTRHYYLQCDRSFGQRSGQLRCLRCHIAIMTNIHYSRLSLTTFAHERWRSWHVARWFVNLRTFGRVPPKLRTTYIYLIIDRPLSIPPFSKCLRDHITSNVDKLACNVCRIAPCRYNLRPHSGQKFHTTLIPEPPQVEHGVIWLLHGEADCCPALPLSCGWAAHLAQRPLTTTALSHDMHLHWATTPPHCSHTCL